MPQLTNAEFRAIREQADLSRGELADILLLNEASGPRTIKQIEQGRSTPTGPVRLIMRLIRTGHLNQVIAASEAED